MKLIGSSLPHFDSEVLSQEIIKSRNLEKCGCKNFSFNIKIQRYSLRHEKAVRKNRRWYISHLKWQVSEMLF